MASKKPGFLKSGGADRRLVAALFLLGMLLLALLAYRTLSGPEACPANLTSPGACAPSPSGPAFADPEAKLSVLSNPNFSLQLFSQAVALEPMLNRSGTQVHMGFWSGPANHGSLVRLLDGINGAPDNGTAQRAIWEEGVQSSLQSPDYVQLNAREHWYERVNDAGRAVIYGVNYTDPYPVSLAQADGIWGAYSQRYADMALLIANATGKPVQVWCYAQGAKSNRVFYTYEFPELQKLEQAGVVRVHFAKQPDADWKNASQWFEGTARAPAPAG